MKADESFTENHGNHAYNEQFQTTEQLHSLADFVIAVMNIFPFNDKHNLNMFDLDIN